MGLGAGGEAVVGGGEEGGEERDGEEKREKRGWGRGDRQHLLPPLTQAVQ